MPKLNYAEGSCPQSWTGAWDVRQGHQQNPLREELSGAPGIKSNNAVFEILFLAFAIIALLRWPKDVRRMRESKGSASAPKSEYQKCGDAAHRAPRRRPLPVEAMTEIG